MRRLLTCYRFRFERQKTFRRLIAVPTLRGSSKAMMAFIAVCLKQIDQPSLTYHRFYHTFEQSLVQ